MWSDRRCVVGACNRIRPKLLHAFGLYGYTKTIVKDVSVFSDRGHLCLRSHLLIEGVLPKLSAHQLVEATDPLTFFSMFNGKRRNAAKRAEAVSRIAGAMGIDVEVPSGFEGVPLTNAQKWRFWDGGPGTIGSNWGLFRAAVAFADGPDEDKGVGLGRLFDVVHA